MIHAALLLRLYQQPDRVVIRRAIRDAVVSLHRSVAKDSVRTHSVRVDLKSIRTAAGLDDTDDLSDVVSSVGPVGTGDMQARCGEVRCPLIRVHGVTTKGDSLIIQLSFTATVHTRTASALSATGYRAVLVRKDGVFTVVRLDPNSQS
jgi:hypothetical protein